MVKPALSTAKHMRASSAAALLCAFVVRGTEWADPDDFSPILPTPRDVTNGTQTLEVRSDDSEKRRAVYRYARVDPAGPF